MSEPGPTAAAERRLESLLNQGTEPSPRPHRQDPIFSKSVLITGAAGSIGSALARQVAAGDTELLTLVDTNESGLFDLVSELKAEPGSRKLLVEPVLATVSSWPKVSRVFGRFKPTFVIHAAAYKHVPLMEAHPAEAVETNLLGTLNVCLAAEQEGCSRLVFLSTDKAVAPTSVMGATKRLAECVIRALSADSSTIFCSVRFGNVLWSRGSVLSAFERQIRRGGPVTLTHPEMERFFISLPDVVDLVIEAASQAAGGETFVLEMGEPVKIIDLARAAIRLYGRSGESIQIAEVGPRPGERLREMLVGPDERVVATAHPRIGRILSAETAPMGRADLIQAVQELAGLAEKGTPETLASELLCLAGANGHPSAANRPPP